MIWDHFRDPWGYFEPFLGSGAVLLHRDSPCRREVVCDTNAYIANFYRSIQREPHAVAEWADWPTIHQELDARTHWLRQWGVENAGRMIDVDFYDPRAAGYWVYGMSHWIGGRYLEDVSNKIPYMAAHGAGGRGVSSQIPHVDRVAGGQGVSAQRSQIPYMDRVAAGEGVSMQRQELQPEGGWKPGARLYDWFDRIAARLQGVIVLDRQWTSALTPTVTGQVGPKKDRPQIAVLIDPPYKKEGGVRGNVYGADVEAAADDVATAAYEWAVEHGDQHLVAYCCREGDFPVPDGWRSFTSGFQGMGKAERREEHRDQIMFSPACVRPQLELF